MKGLRRAVGLLLVGLFVFCASPAQATSLLTSHVEGGVISGVPDYDWWYGCSPTAVGMMTGYYDRNGYDNLVPGVTAELSTHTAGPNHDATQAMIASQGHIDDFYSGLSPSAGYGLSGDDVDPPYHNFNSLADFMGTSQDSVGNSNGSTTWYYYTSGSALHYYEMPGYGLTDYALYGIYEYLDYTGYGSSVVSLYSQYTDNAASSGFTLAEYMDEIDAGRVVVLHVEGHSMLGLGYNDLDPTTIALYDTWSPGPHTMAWGGSYSGMAMYGVTVLELAGVVGPDSVIPEPCTVALLGVALVGLAAARKRRAA